MTNYDRIHLKCQLGHVFQIMCVGIPIDSPADGYIPVTSDDEAAACCAVAWGLYVREPDYGPFIHIEDHPTRESALAAAQGRIEAFNLIARHFLPGEAPK